LLLLMTSKNMQGGSTITQQLVKNVILRDQERTGTRKIKEMVIAQQIEKKFTKDEILGFYLNNVSFGGGVKGIGSAALNYFGKDANKLSVPEIATLIGMVNNPTTYNPTVHKKLSLYRRNIVLERMFTNNVISKEQYLKYKKEPITLRHKNLLFNNDTSKNYALSYAMDQATKSLMIAHGFRFRYGTSGNTEYSKNYNEEYNLERSKLIEGGYTVKTDIDLNVQKNVEKLTFQVMKQQVKTYNGKSTPQVAVSVINNSNGSMRAVVGGLGTQKDYLNRSFQSYRQPGSTSKILVSYPEAYERGWTTQSTLMDSYPDKTHISNWYGSVSHKPYTLRQATIDSVNTIPFKLAEYDSKFKYFDDLKKMQFDGLTLEDRNPIISIGGFKEGVTTSQMASGYSTLARGGEFIPPTNVTSIVDNSNGHIYYQNDRPRTRIFSTGASYLTIDTLKDVIKKGTGKEAKLNNYSYTAGKTGTTDDNKDSYFVGMTRDFTIAVWVGDDHPRALSENEKELPMKVFKNIGQDLMRQSSKKDFDRPATVKGQNGGLLSANPDAVDVNPAKDLQVKNNILQDASSSWNRKRLHELEYRLVYHLTKRQESYNEQQITKKYKRITNNKSMNSQDLEKEIGDLKQLVILNNDTVKKPSSHNSQKAKIEDKISVLSKQLQRNFEETTQGAKKEWEQQQASYRSKLLKDRAKKISALYADYKRQLQEVQNSYYKNSDDRTDKANNLLKTINSLRSYGEQVPDPMIEEK
ncbi:transglycosylase domain-containing protein, partial [Pediococcus pentosaceus]|uniref:transglycosylase domain-containing protein n=1 Tax=Pediococcus pentosaceus TaxID=1255 RepID=UPI00223BC155